MNQSILEAAKEILLGEAKTEFKLPKNEKELMAMLKNAKNIQTTEEDDAGSKLLSDTPKNVSKKLSSILKNQEPWLTSYENGQDGEGMGQNRFRKGTLAYDLYSTAWDLGDDDAMYEGKMQIGEAKTEFKLPKNEKELMAMLKNAKNIQTTEEDDAGRSLLSDTPKNVSKKLSSILKNQEPWLTSYENGQDGEGMGQNRFRKGTLAYDLYSTAWDLGDDDAM